MHEDLFWYQHQNHKTNLHHNKIYCHYLFCCRLFSLQGVQTHLVSYVLDNAADLTYDRFSKEIDNMIGRDRNWTNLIFAYYVGKRVCLMTSDACSTVKGYFEQYLGRSYRRPMQEAGGIVSSTSLQSVFLLLFTIFFYLDWFPKVWPLPFLQMVFIGVQITAMASKLSSLKYHWSQVTLRHLVKKWFLIFIVAWNKAMYCARVMKTFVLQLENSLSLIAQHRFK